MIVHFWSTWCPTCRHELSTLDQLAEQLAEQPLEVVAVAIDDRREQLTTYFAGQTPHYRICLDDGKLKERFGAIALPQTAFITGSGKDTMLRNPQSGLLEARFIGERDWRSPSLQRGIIEQLRSMK